MGVRRLDPRPATVSMFVWTLCVLGCLLLAPELVPVAILCFIQNISFTFVSRGRNSGSLGYHLVASLFSNGLYVLMLCISVDVLTAAEANIGAFAVAYTLSCASGSVFAHWLALRIERGKARNVQEDRVAVLEKRIDDLAARWMGGRS